VLEKLLTRKNPDARPEIQEAVNKIAGPNA